MTCRAATDCCALESCAVLQRRHAGALHWDGEGGGITFENGGGTSTFTLCPSMRCLVPYPSMAAAVSLAMRIRLQGRNQHRVNSVHWAGVFDLGRVLRQTLGQVAGLCRAGRLPRKQFHFLHPPASPVGANDDNTLGLIVRVCAAATTAHDSPACAPKQPVQRRRHVGLVCKCQTQNL